MNKFVQLSKSKTRTGANAPRLLQNTIGRILSLNRHVEVRSDDVISNCRNPKQRRSLHHATHQQLLRSSPFLRPLINAPGNIGSTREVSVLLQKYVVRSTDVEETSVRKDLEAAVSTVRAHDPAGFLPGALLPPGGRAGYFAVRAFWVETGLRMSHLPAVGATNYDVARARSRDDGGAKLSPEERIRWWRRGINALYDENGEDEEAAEIIESHPVLRLLRYTLRRHDLSPERFLCVVDGRERDVNIKQYQTMDDLVGHSTQCCGSLLNLTLQCLDVSEEDDPAAHRAARRIGTCHGLANALRMSVPIVSNTGKVIVPQELCHKYGVTSPRFLLSALGQGDTRCVEAMRSAVRDIAGRARACLVEARELRSELARSESAAALLPGLAAETFLNRLEAHDFDLTSKNLRQVGPVEHASCAARTVAGRLNGTY